MQPTPAAFMSYVEQDNQYVDGRLNELGQRLSAAVRFHTGEDFVVFQEQLDVAWGQNWQERIHASLDAALFLIPVLTPGFFNDTACRAVLERFLERERALGRNDLILPIYYVNVPPLNDPARVAADPLVQAIAALLSQLPCQPHCASFPTLYVRSNVSTSERLYYVSILHVMTAVTLV